MLVLYDDLVEPADMPSAVYGQYPRALIGKMLPWLRCERREVLHVCSGSLPPGEGIRVDVRPEARPDILADGRALPLVDGCMAAVLIDPPYSAHYARALYVRPIAYSRWCILARAELARHIWLRCGATIDQAEAVRIADDVPADERCTACVAEVQLAAVTADATGLLELASDHLPGGDRR